MSKDALSHPVIVIVGPTASGKSDVAQWVAAALDGEIVSADSMQIYKGMDIGTGKILPKDRKVPHFGIDIVEPGKPYSAALFQSLARDCFADIDARGKRALLVGGTGLYVRAAIDDYSFPHGDQTDNPVRDFYSAYAKTHGEEALWNLLYERDPQSAKLIHPHNVRRVVRAFEMFADGTRYADQAEHLKAIPQYVPARFFGLAVQKDVLNERIDRRVDAMIEAGLVEEVSTLLKEGWRSGLTAPQAIGYKEIVNVLDGQWSLDEAIEAIKVATHRYAKRQRTWFRKDARIEWIDADSGDALTLANEILALLDDENTQALSARKCQNTRPQKHLQTRNEDSMNLNFIKLNGLGNDFIMIDDLDRSLELSVEEVQALCDRHFGIGADGVIMVRPSSRSECVAYMHYINSDGSLAQMCGNGVRCFAKYLVDERIVDPNLGIMTVETMAGPRTISYTVDNDDCLCTATVNMGTPILNPKDVPVSEKANALTADGKPFVREKKLSSPFGTFAFTMVSMGNPHAVCFIDDWDALSDDLFSDPSQKSLETFNVSLVGAFFESHPAFPEKANIEFACICPHGISMRVFERGCGETLACGTGACATNVAAVLTERAGHENDIQLLGGTLHILWDKHDQILMTGPAVKNFQGLVTIERNDA